MANRSTAQPSPNRQAEKGIRAEFEYRHRRTKKGKKEKKTTSDRRPRKMLGQAVMKGASLEPSNGGRPSILTKELIEKMASIVRAGNFMTTAAAKCSVSRDTIYAWKARGEVDERAGVDSLYREFSDTVRAAEADAEMAAVEGLLQAGPGYSAYCWWLERRRPQCWGQQMRLTLEDAQDFVRHLFEALTKHIPDQAVLQKIREEVKAMQGVRGGPHG